MAPRAEKSQLKRGRASNGDEHGLKKPRRSERINSQTQPEGDALKTKTYLPSPLTHKESTATEEWKEGTATPPEGRPSQIRHRTPISSPPMTSVSSPPQENTQAFSQAVNTDSVGYAVDDEIAEGVWGYLLPLDSRLGENIVLKKRTACPLPPLRTDFGRSRPSSYGTPTTTSHAVEEEIYEKQKESTIPAGGYLIGRHPECDRILELATISNRHCLIFSENSHGDTIAVLEDLSSNGTFVNEVIVGRNKRRVLNDGDEITILNEARFTFRYPKYKDANRFHQQYTLLQKLGKGHFATVNLCIEKNTGQRFAVKIFQKRPGTDERSKTDGLQQEIAVLMGVSHPNMLCLKDIFDEEDGVYLVLELATEGELFNWIILKSKLTESETRKVFIQLFQAIKYLHERNIVHRDIKPENILLVDKYLTVKLADFGLAKIIGEESFTRTLCGTPSYVAPEILEDSDHRKYTRAVDVWSLGVVLYICLCGFPPFSDELNTRENPYTLSQQIKLGRFDYPSPYWDSVGDPALDLIDRMLTVEVEKRITIDECLDHPWLTQQPGSLNDSTDGLTGAMDSLDFSKRKVHRERTLLSSINDIKVSQVIDIEPGRSPIKVFEKNTTAKSPAKSPTPKKLDGATAAAHKEATPASQRDPQEFMELGGKGDQPLFGDDAGSIYAPETVVPKKSDD
ncbi:MAG: hypothetical protein M4579_002355 [Chaenotheca gracillima]|nr:MAG: hypothetical protein M4579_002355 [Chaenotheca gracillima]